jgi:hypothetical protein
MQSEKKAKIIEFIVYAGICAGLLLIGYGFGKLDGVPEPLEEYNTTQRIMESQLRMYEGKICVDLEGEVLIASFTPTGSMLPTLSSRNLAIQMKPENESDVRVGDIVAYQREDYIVVHRVVDITENGNITYYQVKGDNNREYDPFWIPFDKIIGIQIITFH